MSRTIVKKVRFTAAELNRIKELAREAGCESVARYLRERGLKQLRAGKKERELAELIHVANCLHSLALDSMNKNPALARDIRAAMTELLDYTRMRRYARS